MHAALSVLTPQCIATEAFTNATAAVARLDEIYERNTAFLRDCFGAHANGETISTRVRATYPFVRITTTTHARLDSRLSYGFVAGPGVYETTVTRPDLSRAYLTEQIKLLIENHAVPVEIDESNEPIPIHFAYRRDIKIEALLTRRPKQVCPQMSAHVGDALLGIRLGHGRWLRRQLKHCCRLTLAQERQQHDPSIRKFERIVMCGRLVLVDLSKDCRPVDGLRLPPQQASRQARHFPGEGQFRSRHHTDRESEIFRGGEAARPGAEVAGHELIADLRGPRTYALEAKVTHL
jgi:Bacterial AMP nucleoside phosphorylase N-terminus